MSKREPRARVPEEAQSESGTGEEALNPPPTSFPRSPLSDKKKKKKSVLQRRKSKVETHPAKEGSGGGGGGGATKTQTNLAVPPS